MNNELKPILARVDHTLLSQTAYLGPDPGHLRRWREVRLRQRVHPRQLCEAGGGIRGGQAAHLHRHRLPQRL